MLTEILQLLDCNIKAFCKTHKNYNFYRVGSSLFHEDIPCNDIDYIVVDSDSTINYTQQINFFKDHFSKETFSQCTIPTFDNKLESLFSNYKIQIRNSFDRDVTPIFGFGPIPNLENSITIHLAGPMNVESMNYFFKNYPVFYLVFSNYNLKLGIDDFNILLKRPECKKEEIGKAINEILKRATNTDSLYFRKQCLKRIKLIESIYAKHSSPYLVSHNFVESLPNELISKELNRYLEIQ